MLIAETARDVRLGALASFARRFALVHSYNVNRALPPRDPIMRLAYRRVRLTIFRTHTGEREVLAAAGLEVIVATSGDQAMEWLQQQSFDIVLLDSKMPGSCSSEDIYRWMQKYHPDQAAKTVLVLSNVSDPGVRVFVDATKIMCLVKPFEVPDLLALVRRLLRKSKVAAQPI